MTSTNRRILIATVIVAMCTLVVKMTGAGKDLVLAGTFGISASLDTFLLAYLFPAVCVNILAGSMQAAFVPKYVITRSTEGEAAAAAFVASTAPMLFLALASTAVLVAPVAMTAVPLIAGKLPPEHVAQARWMAAAMAPIVLLTGLTNFWSGFLNTHNRFALPALIPVVTPTCIALAAVIAGSTRGAPVLVVAALMGGVIEVLVVSVAARAQGAAMFFGRLQLTAKHRAMLWQFAAAAAGNVLMGATMIVDQSFAASLGEGSVSTLNFGIKLPQVLAGIFTMAIATAVLPNAARLVGERDWVGLRATLRSYTVLILSVTIPITALLVFFSHDIVRLLFERGAFDREDTAAVSFVQALAALQIPFFAWSMLIVRVLSAISANAVLMVGSSISLILDVALNYSLVPLLGVAGTGLATSIMYLSACIFLSLSLRRRLQRLEAVNA